MNELTLVQTVSLSIVCIIASVVLSGWLVPVIGAHLPFGWTGMKANTALLALLSAASLGCSRRNLPRRYFAISRILTALVAILSTAVGAEYLLNRRFGVDTFLAADSTSPHPGLMAPQTVAAFYILALVMFLIRARDPVLSKLGDLLSLLLCVQVLVMTSGYIFGARHLFGVASSVRSSPQTLVCLILLALIAFGRRAQYGVFSILYGSGLGSSVARIACPLALVVPFVLEVVRNLANSTHIVSTVYVTAISTSLVSLLAVGLILLLASRIESLEIEVRDLSLRDALTNLYNRRGFYVLADQALRLAQRSRIPFSVLFIDVDGLKQINDTFGHDAGSAVLLEVATVLQQFIRKSDILGRLGGDEFVVAGQSGHAEIKNVAHRLAQAAVDQQAIPGRAYPFSFSIGYVTSEAADKESLNDLLNRADEAMYINKRLRKTGRTLTLSAETMPRA